MSTLNLSIVSKLLTASIICMTVGVSSVSASVNDTQARQLYNDALYALRKGHWKTFAKTKKQLTDYVLFPYLEYEEQRKRLKFNRSPNVVAFLEKYPDFILNWNLRNQEIKRLTKRKRWQDVLDLYKPTSNADVQCGYLRAKLATKQFGKAEQDQAMALWKVGKSQPKACDPLFGYLSKRKLISKEDVWDRIFLAMANRKLSLAKYLSTKLSKDEQKLVKNWQRLHKRPATYLKKTHLFADTKIGRDIIVHGLKRLSPRNAELAYEQFQELKTKYNFSAEQISTIAKKISVSGATQYVPDSYNWFSEINEAHFDEPTHAWHVRSALRGENWEGVYDAINKMPVALQSANEWQYWRGRSLSRIGYVDDAVDIFRSLASERSYYGFLAADQLNLPPNMFHKSVTVVDELTKDITAHPRLHAAYEFYQLNMIPHANREWRAMLKELSPSEQTTAAFLAHQWGWYRQAIATLHLTGHPDDLNLRFPTPFQEDVRTAAETQKIDPAWVYGIIRKESAFDQNAISGAGARGLMQLLPATGKETARLIRERFAGANDLYQPTKNIKLGSAYLRQMKERFNNNTILATAAYNAGPHRIKKWLPKEQPMAADIWIETIPFKETRGYAQAVTAFTSVFQWKLGNELKPLSDRLKLIMPKQIQLADNTHN